MIWQHDAACTDPNDFGRSGDMADDNRCRGAGDAGHVVVFGEPVPAVPPLFGMTGEVSSVAQSGRCVTTLHDRGQVENGKRYHAAILSHAPQSSTPLFQNIYGRRVVVGAFTVSACRHRRDEY